MFCGNCGKQIIDEVTFCPECGAFLGKLQQSNIKKKPFIDEAKLKKIIILPSVLLLVAIAAITGAKIFSYIKSIPSDREITEVVNNRQNGALVASDGKWVYYNNNGLCKALLKDVAKQSVVANEVYPEELFWLGDTLYYWSWSDYYKYSGKGDESVKLGFDLFSKNCFQYDGKKYYVAGQSNYDENGIYSVDPNNIEKATKISDVLPTCILMYKDYLYVMSRFNKINDEPNEYYGTWRMDKNGENMIYLLDYSPTYMVFSDDLIFYTNLNHQLCSMTLDGSYETVYEDVFVGSGLNVSDNYVFYIDGSTDVICRIDISGNDMQQLNNDRSDNLTVIGEWIFYTNKDYDYDIYKMSFDGSFNQPIY